MVEYAESAGLRRTIDNGPERARRSFSCDVPIQICEIIGKTQRYFRTACASARRPTAGNLLWRDPQRAQARHTGHRCSISPSRTAMERRHSRYMFARRTPLWLLAISEIASSTLRLSESFSALDNMNKTTITDPPRSLREC